MGAGRRPETAPEPSSGHFAAGFGGRKSDGSPLVGGRGKTPGRSRLETLTDALGTGVAGSVGFFESLQASRAKPASVARTKEECRMGPLKLST